MSDLVRGFTARLREFVRDRRCARRYATRLSCQVEFAKSNRATNGSRRASPIEGHTRDLSTDGVALLLPAIRLGDHYLAGEARPLTIRLELPAATIQMEAVAVRYDGVDERDAGAGYVVGARITKMGDQDRSHYVDFLTGLSQK